MTRLRYPFSALMGDYLRGLAGLVISLVILVTYDSGNRLIWLFVGLTLLFLAYTIRTVLRHSTVVELDETGLTLSQAGRRARRIDWSRLDRLSLRYYASRKNKKKGFGSLLGRIGLSSDSRGSDGRGSDNRGTDNREADGPDAAEEGRLPGDGWMELTLRAAGQPVTIDSALPQFDLLLQRADEAAKANGLELDPITSDNLAALSALYAQQSASRARPSQPAGFSGSSFG